MRYLLDTNAIIAMLNDARSSVALAARRHSPAALCISSIASHELFYGAFKSMRRDRNVALIDKLPLEIVDFDKEDARMAGHLRARLAADGMPIGPYDILIAGQAMSRQMTLVTHNVAEFSRIPGLLIEDWETLPKP